MIQVWFLENAEWEVQGEDGMWIPWVPYSAKGNIKEWNGDGEELGYKSKNGRHSYAVKVTSETSAIQRNTRTGTERLMRATKRKGVSASRFFMWASAM